MRDRDASPRTAGAVATTEAGGGIPAHDRGHEAASTRGVTERVGDGSDRQQRRGLAVDREGPDASARQLFDRDADWHTDAFALVELTNVLATSMRTGLAASPMRLRGSMRPRHS